MKPRSFMTRGRTAPVILAGMLVAASALLVVAPDRWRNEASASASCPTGTGYGGQVTSNANDGLTQGGHGCVVIVHGSTTTVFDYTGAVQQWTVPSGVTSIEVHLIGAGGGASISGPWAGAQGGGGGYSTGALAVSPGAVYDVIVGQGGRHMCDADIAAIIGDEDARRNFSFGGGAAGFGNINWNCSWASGGGRSALRSQGGTDDIVTAGGGGGGGYEGGIGGAGGGLSGIAGTLNDGVTAQGGAGGGGSQVAGGTGGTCGEDGYSGIKYAGGPAGVNTSVPAEAGGGGGGYYGGGGGCNNKNGGGGSSYIGGVSSGVTVAGSGRVPGAVPPANSALPTITGTARVGDVLSAVGGTWTGATSTSFTWQSSPDGSTWTTIAGAVGSTYTVGVGGFIRVVETASNYFGTTSANSTQTAAIVDTTLANLEVSHGTLTPSFSTGVFAYTVTVPYTRTTLTVTPTRAHPLTTLTVNGTTVASGAASEPLALSVGANSVVVVATNTGVSATTTITVTREAATAPGAPSIVSVTGGDRRVTVAFSAPASDGGEPISDYEYSLNGSAWITAGSTVSPLVISNLSQSTTYSVRLRAVNRVGAGSSSPSVSGTTSTPPTTTTTSPAPAPTTTEPTTTVAPPGAVSDGAPPPAASGVFPATPTPSPTAAPTSSSVPPPQPAVTTTTTTVTVTTTTTTTTTIPTAPDVAEGSATIIANGQPLPVAMDRTGGVVTTRSGTLATTLAAVDDKGEVIPFDGAGNLRVKEGGSIRVTAEGFAPMTAVEVWLFSDPMRLGATLVGTDGTLERTHVIPDGVDDGQHTVLMVGTSAVGVEVEVAISIMVGEPPTLATAGRAVLLVALVLAVIGALFLPAALRRRRKDDPEQVTVASM